MSLLCPSCKKPLVSEAFRQEAVPDKIWTCPIRTCHLRDVGHYFYIETSRQEDPESRIVSWGIPFYKQDKSLYLRSSEFCKWGDPSTELEPFGSLSSPMLQLKQFFPYPGDVDGCYQIAERLYNLLVFS